MPEFERTKSSLIRKVIDEEIRQPKIGIVEEVSEHQSADDDSNFEVDLSFDGGTKKETRVPVHSPGNDHISAPKVGDKLIVFFTEASGRPVAFGTGWSNTDRPPVGKAGVYKNSFESGSSPSGDGNLNVTGYTKYDGDPAQTDKRDLTAEETFVQISKHAEGENLDPSDAGDIPAKIEMYDSPKADESWITVEIDKRDGSASQATWGLKFDIKSGEFKLVDPNGFGITSDGDGNFEWQYKTLVENQESTGGLSL